MLEIFFFNFKNRIHDTSVPFGMTIFLKTYHTCVWKWRDRIYAIKSDVLNSAIGYVGSSVILSV